MAAAVERRRRSLRGPAWLLITVALLLVLVWAGIVARTALSLRGHLEQLQAIAATPAELDPGTTCWLVDRVNDDLRGLQRQAGG